MLEVLVKVCIPGLSIMLSENKIEGRLENPSKGSFRFSRFSKFVIPVSLSL